MLKFSKKYPLKYRHFSFFKVRSKVRRVSSVFEEHVERRCGLVEASSRKQSTTATSADRFE